MGGDGGMLGRSHSDETKELMSNSHKGKRSNINNLNLPSGKDHWNFGSKSDNATSKYHGIFIDKRSVNFPFWRIVLTVKGKNIQIRRF